MTKTRIRFPTVNNQSRKTRLVPCLRPFSPGPDPLAPRPSSHHLLWSAGSYITVLESGEGLVNLFSRCPIQNRPCRATQSSWSCQQPFWGGKISPLQCSLGCLLLWLRRFRWSPQSLRKRAQQVPHGQEPSSRKPRAGFKSPVFSIPSLPSPAVTSVKSPEVVGSSPAKQQQQQLFSVAIRPVTRKGSKYTDAGELFPSNICYQFQNASSTPLLTPESAGDDAKQMVADSREHRQGCQPPPVSFPHTLCGPG